MKISVTGAQGNLGKELVKRGCTPIHCDITQPNDLMGEISAINPDVVIHCAALTDVKYCQSHFRETFDVNVRGTANVAGALTPDKLLIYLSSDHVFSGENWFDNGYGEWHKPSPVNDYGFSKWGGELAARTGVCRTIIVRSSRCFDYNWAKSTIDQLNNNEQIVFTDLIKRSFVHSQHFIDGLMYMIDHYKEYDEEIIHISGDSVFSYYRFWSIVKRVMNLPGEIISRREKLKDEAPRPFRAGLNIKLAKKLGIPIYGITDGIKLLEKGI